MISADNQSDTHIDGQPQVEHKVLLTAQQKRFYASDECKSARKALQDMADNSQYNTTALYDVDDDIGFVEKHLRYLSMNSAIDPYGYLSNLKVRTDTKRRN